MNGKQNRIHMHRVVAERAGMETARLLVDHIDQNPLNNQRINLRPATHSNNLGNRPANNNNTSGYKGVFKHRNSWQAKIQVKGKPIHLGNYVDIKDAARAYNAAATKHFGEFAFLNSI